MKKKAAQAVCKVAVLLLFFGLLFSGIIQEARAWSIGEHWDMTKEVLEKEGWKNEKLMGIVIDSDMAVDLIGISVGGTIYPNVGAQKARVKELIKDAPFNTKGTNGFHFDDLFKFSDIQKRWSDLRTWALNKASSLTDMEDSFRLMGIVFHAVEDFYCHSNWVRLLNQFTPSKNFNPTEFPKWEELIDNEGNWRGNHPEFPSEAAINQLKGSDFGTSNRDDKGGLQTGRWEQKTTIDPATGKPFKPWKHRDPDKNSPEGKVAWELAKRAKEEWKHKLLGHFPWELGGYVNATQAYEGIRFNSSAHDNFITMFQVSVGTLFSTEEVSIYFLEEELTSGLILKDLKISEARVSPFDSPSLNMTVLSENIIVNIMNSSDAASATRSAISAGWLSIQRLGGFGGIVIPVDKFVLLAPYIALASTILVATAATAIYVKRVKRRKEKQ